MTKLSTGWRTQS